MDAQIGKWGNSLALRIPSGVARELGLAEGSGVRMVVEGASLVVKARESVPVYDIDELVAGITDENRHEEIDTHVAVGNEFA